MNLNPERIATRERLILTGLYLSKYDSLGLKKLGFESFVEAFNVLGYAMASRPASIKNYRDEFDPVFPNPRKGWHKRPMRACCLKVLQEYQNLDFESFTGLVKSFVLYDENLWSEFRSGAERDDKEACFAARLATGIAAEQYFESVHSTIAEFEGYALENTTHLGCGYDFRLQADTLEDSLAVEVKGLRDQNGSVSLTPKEHEAAAAMGDRFFLFVVKNFRDTPFHEMFRNPLLSKLVFRRNERVVVQVSWLATV